MDGLLYLMRIITKKMLLFDSRKGKDVAQRQP